jgi:hypothetical protein
MTIRPRGFHFHLNLQPFLKTAEFGRTSLRSQVTRRKAGQVELFLRRRLTNLALTERVRGWCEVKLQFCYRKADFWIEQESSSGSPLSFDISMDEILSCVAAR